MKEDLEADIEESEQRREEIMRSSLHEDQFPEEEISDLSEEMPEEAEPVEELKVNTVLAFSFFKKLLLLHFLLSFLIEKDIQTLPSFCYLAKPVIDQIVAELK